MILWQFPPFVLPVLAGGLISLALGFIALNRHRNQQSVIFILLTLSVAVWSFCNVMENLSVPQERKIFWATAGYFGICSAITFWAIFALHVGGYAKWFTRRNLALLAIEPILVWIFAWTNNSHNLFWSEIGLQNIGSYVVLDVTYGPVFWRHAIYSYLLLLFSTVMLLRAMRRSPEIYRGQMTALIIAVFAPWIGNGVYLLGFTPVDITPFTFSVTGLALAWALFRFHLLDIVPVVHDLVMESIGDGVMVLDAESRIVDINAAVRRIVGDEVADSMIGKTTEQVFPDLHNSVRGKITMDATTEISLGEGETGRVFELRVSPLYDRSKKLIGRVVISHEITERKRTEAQIRAQNEALVKTNADLEVARRKAEEATQLKSQFLANMSHELRTPLNAIIGYSDIVLANMAGDLTDEQRKYQERVLVNAEHLLSLINDILDLSKVEAGRIEIAHKPFDLREWAQAIEFQTKGLADKKGLHFESHIDNALPALVVGDAARLKQVIINLLSNAIKFTDQGCVRLNIVKQGDDTWTLAVSDTGIGIPSEMQDTIFEEFRQVDSSSRRAYGGTGLGLAISRRFAMLMGGSVRVNSEVGKGSTFTVTLPLIPGDPEAVFDEDDTFTFKGA
jgi:PAS domain S-box-containing protein